jgi:Asp-tRNA(Asn)/Glu-tRNA(Gln) amidotransferase A subunit family amidase
MHVPSQGEKNPDRLAELLGRFQTDRSAVLTYLTGLKNLFSKREPLIQAFVPESFDFFDSFRDEFARLEKRFPKPSSRPSLFGIPLGVKDIFRVKGFPTRAGSRLPREIFEGPEARSVTLLKSSGAVVFGKTATTEFAYFAPCSTRNPHNLRHTPGGSSSGSAAAVSAGLCPVAVGTQTIGSVLRPASYCGVVGFKPTYGRIPLDGIIPLAPSLDQVGCFAADVEGTELVASVLCADWVNRPEEPPLLFGVPEGPYLERTSEIGLNHFRQICDRLKDAGCTIRSIAMFADFMEIVERHNTLVAAEAAIVHRDWFERYSDRYHESTSGLIKRGQAVGPEVLQACRTGREKLRSRILKKMKSEKISALLAPAAVGPAPHGLDSTGDPVMNLPWTYAGLPAMSLPSGMSKGGLPMGLQVVGPWMGDEGLLKMARRVGGILDYPPP